MELYSVILFVHIVSGMGVAAALASFILIEGRARRARTPRVLKMLYASDLRVAEKMKMLALVQAVSGLYMVYAHWSIASAWVIEALVIFVYLASTGPLVFGRRMRSAVELAERAGIITAEVHLKLHDPVIATLGRLRISFLALLVFLMTIKPGPAVTLAAFLVALTLGVASGVVARRGSREVSEAM